MLVLTRRVGEAITLTGGIQIKVLGCPRQGRVQLGFTAPDECRIMREELTAVMGTTGDTSEAAALIDPHTQDEAA